MKIGNFETNSAKLERLGEQVEMLRMRVTTLEIQRWDHLPASGINYWNI